ncbi:MAG: hypothetical protein JSW04_00080 [Desulfobacterales bacterium]|nr:MAG: hypothetical protein JSW04_00080 [Desulfobacterales bacterium]
MTYSNPTLGKEVAWNGIRFLSPVAWEIGKIGKHYLMLEDEGEPVMEIKWRKIKGTFSPRAQLQRLMALHKKKQGMTLKKIPVPARWENMVEHYQCVCFSWHTETIGGIGIVLYCSHCRTSTLMQFFQDKTRTTENIATHLLASFQDHPKNGQVAWTIFDITAKIPDDFELLRYRFEPGVYELVFTRKGYEMTLYRWGPASILLRERDLLHHASNMFGIPQADLTTKKINGHDGVDANIFLGSDGWGRITNLLRPKRQFGRSRMWLLEDKNRLLGVKMDGKQPIDLPLFEQVCHYFDSI